MSGRSIAFGIALVLSTVFVPIRAYPGSNFLGRFPTMRVPPKLQMSGLPARLSENMQDRPARFSLPNMLRNAAMCCTHTTAECLACAANQDLSHFCVNHVRVPGCESILEKTRQRVREQALDGILNKAVERAAEAVGGTKAEALADDYLESHPGVARKNLANLTSEAFDTIANIKSSILRSKELAAKMETMSKSSSRLDRRDDVEDDDTDDDDAEADPHQRSSKKERGNSKMLSEEDAAHEGYALSFQNPWVIAIAALIVTAVSSGIAVGALCHARIQTHAREPLLSTLLQEMEPRTPSATSA